jgi:predicted nucleotidyltransferase
MARPRRQTSAVARVLLRLPAELHETLARAAATAGLSFNEFCVRRLRAPAQPEDMSALRSLVIDRARSAFGDHLRGIVVMGSWARGDAATHSDIDVLIVIDAATPLTRDLYRVWDESPLMFEGRTIDAHFVHAPPPDAPVTGVWCEAAVDGLVWFDPDGRIARRLAHVRRSIATGRVVRATAHGQPYWKGAA